MKSPTQALNIQFILPPASANLTEQKTAFWQRRALQVGDYRLVLKSEPVMELLHSPAIYPIPFAPKHCPGLINLRGRLIPVFNALDIFAVASSHKKHPYVLVLGRDQDAIAFIISRVLEQIRLEQAPELKPAHLNNVPSILKNAIDGLLSFQNQIYWQIDHQRLLKQLIGQKS